VRYPGSNQHPERAASGAGYFLDTGVTSRAYVQRVLVLVERGAPHEFDQYQYELYVASEVTWVTRTSAKHE
jgi:hypothetical protein